ncbi:uncharacterized protein LOC132201076 [Neocloeon triangulifer]|uniref:uncharacterized protein LOC132201076 n=1 Tax=Neocloeon triangulifer TaxID=2078957 RepID=UPI00286EEB7E|nr:uncharacterized protein LOC132201076 [Neocloeon triangulifer]
MWCVLWAAAWFASVLGATHTTSSWSSSAPPRPPKCKLSQFTCHASTARCVSLDRFCDGVDDCGDNSDEPRFCTPCNRTYFGEVGRTYEIEIRRPHEDQLPFACHLNFTAAGGQWGDLVQLTFDSFTVGKFMSFAKDGCPHGHMSITELGLPDTGGQWCGSAWGYTVYFSEVNSVNVTLALLRLSEQGIGYTFDFKLNYRFLLRSEAALRFGVSDEVDRGMLVPGTYCDRIFTRCDTRKCRLQSPNFPGIYPRNVTCRYAIVQLRVPDGSHATITVRQPDSRRMHVKDRIVQYERSQRVLRVGDQCNVIRDHLTVYDGFTSDSKRTETLIELFSQPTRNRRATSIRRKIDALANGTLEVSSRGAVIARLCGGDAVPDIVSSGPRMLVEFSTSPFDNPFHPAPVSYLPGFELDIEVKMVPAVQPRSYAQQGKCVFTVSSFESRQGQLGPPLHSLPANTTCRYEFAGRPNERVWIAFLKYHVAERVQSKGVPSLGSARVPLPESVPGTEDSKKADEAKEEEDNDCPARLRIWDGAPSTLPHIQQENSTKLLGEFCRDESPRLCDHSLLSNSTRFPRPCTADESYLSTGPKFTLEHFLRYGTALHPVSFVLRYEFVDVSQGGAPVTTTAPPFSLPATSPGPWTCDREFKHDFRKLSGGDSGTFRSPKAVFFYGRGGNANLTCMYWFLVAREQQQSVRLTVNRAKFGERRCVTRFDPDTGRRRCEFRGKNVPTAQLRFFEAPWPNVMVARDCVCDKVTAANSVVVESAPGASLVVNFTVVGMNVTQDASDFLFEADYKFSLPDKTSMINSIGPCSFGDVDDQRLQGISGDLTLRSPSNVDSNAGQIPATQALRGGYGDECRNHPWLIELQEPFNYLYVRVRGLEITNGRGGDECRTRNRVVVHRVNTLIEPTVICPDENGGASVGIFSPGWKSVLPITSRPPPGRHERSLVVEFLEREPGGPYALNWLEIFHRPSATVHPPRDGKVRGEALLSAGLQSQPDPVRDCPWRCPELDACISPDLWCDGAAHCPSGFDELDTNCQAQAHSPILDMFGGSMFVVYLAAGAAALLIAVSLVTCVIVTTVRLKRRAAVRDRTHSWCQNGGAATGLGPPPMTATLRHKNGTLRSNRGVGTIYGKDDLC